jgi:hypothetical protein
MERVASLSLSLFVTNMRPSQKTKKTNGQRSTGNVISHFRYWYHYWKWAAHFQHWYIARLGTYIYTHFRPVGMHALSNRCCFTLFCLFLLVVEIHSLQYHQAHNTAEFKTRTRRSRRLQTPPTRRLTWRRTMGCR